MTHPNKERCRVEGAVAFAKEGLGPDANPYPASHDEHKFWLDGYNEAKALAEPAKLINEDDADDFHGDQDEIDAEEQHEADKVDGHE
jgi:hypothetical protein